MDFLLVCHVEHRTLHQLCGKWTDGREREFLASATSTGAGSYTENANAAMAGVWSRYCLRRSEPHLAVGAYFLDDSSSHCASQINNLEEQRSLTEDFAYEPICETYTVVRKPEAKDAARGALQSPW
ncbi:hypothetical protein Tco_0901025 [Tanacetum coccineum]